MTNQQIFKHFAKTKKRYACRQCGGFYKKSNLVEHTKKHE